MEYQHGGDVYTHEGMIDFSANINPLGAGRAVVSAAHDAVDRISRYPDPCCRRLRKILAEELKTEKEFLIFGNGGAELIFSLVMAERPKKAVLLAPSFIEYRHALMAFGCREIVLFHLSESEDFQLKERYLEYLNEDIDMIFLCSPSNPVGNVIGQELLLRILKRCEEKKIRMVADESFYEFLDSWEDATLQQQVREYPNLFILRAFTKMYGMPGLRLGYGMCSDRRLLEKMERMRQPWNISVVAQEAGAAAVKDRLHPIRTREFLRTERSWVVEELEKIGVRYFMPCANYVFIKSGYDLYEELLKCGILIRDCRNYDGLDKGYYRFAIRKHQDNQKLLEELKRIYRRR